MDLKKYLSAIISLLLFFIIGTMIKCSNQNNPEQEQQGQVYYSFDWCNLMSGSTSPKQLRYCFYPKDGGPAIMMDYGTGNLTFTLPPASYKVLIFNCDADNLAFRNLMDYETAEAYIPVTKATDGTQTGNIPLYGITSEEIKVIAGENNPVEFKLEPLIRRISINVKLQGAEHVSDCCGSISDMPAAINLSRQTIVPDVTVNINFKTTPTAEGVEASVIALGKPTDKTGEQPEAPVHTVTLEITLQDGSSASTSIEIGDEIENTDGPDVDVNIDATVTPGPTMTLTINHWEVAPGDSLVIE